MASLSSTDGRDLAHQIAQLAASGLPLAAGLRAAAEEAPSASLAAALRSVAADLERGRPLDEILAGEQALPPQVAGLVAAGIRTGRLGRVLVEMTEQQRAIAEAYRSIYSSLVYPALLGVLAVVVLAIEAWWLMPLLRGMWFDPDFIEVEMPLATQVIFWLSETGVPLLLGSLAAVAFVLVVVRLVLGPARVQWVLTQTPVIGTLWHDAGTAEFCLMLGILLEEQVPLPEALRMTGGSLGDPMLAEACGRLAERVALGYPFAPEVAAARLFPASLLPLAEFGERTGSLAASLRTGGEMFLGRVRLRASLLATILPPFAYLALAGAGALLIAGTVMPLLSAIRMLSL